MTNLSETHLVGENTVVALVPEVRKPVEAGKLEVLKRTSRLGDIWRVLGNLDELRAVVARVLDRLVWVVRLRLALAVLGDLVLGAPGLELIERLPRTVLVVETGPLDEVLRRLA